MGALIPYLVNPLGPQAENAQREAQTTLTRQQVPLVQSQTAAIDLENKLRQRQLDEAAEIAKEFSRTPQAPAAQPTDTSPATPDSTVPSLQPTTTDESGKPSLALAKEPDEAVDVSRQMVGATPNGQPQDSIGPSTSAPAPTAPVQQPTSVSTPTVDANGQPIAPVSPIPVSFGPPASPGVSPSVVAPAIPVAATPAALPSPQAPPLPSVPVVASPSPTAIPAPAMTSNGIPGTGPTWPARPTSLALGLAPLISQRQNEVIAHEMQSDLGHYDNLLRGGKVTMGTIAAIQKMRNEHYVQMANLTDKQRAEEKDQIEKSADLLQAYRNNPTQQQWNQTRQNLIALGRVDPKTLPIPAPDKPFVDAGSAILGDQSRILKNLETAASTSEKQAQAGEAGAKATEAGASAEQKRVETKIKQYELNALSDTPTDVKAKVAASIDPIKYPEIYARTVANIQNAPTLPLKNAALMKGSEEIATREREMDPAHRAAVIADEIKKAVSIKSATIPMEIAADVQKQVQLAALSPDAFAGIYDPRARAQAETAYRQDSAKYADEVSDAKRLQDFVGAAQSGNKAAPGLIGVTELRGLVNRVNSQELQAVGSAAGSAYDRLVGHLKGWTEGEPIPPEVLKDTKIIADAMQSAADRKYLSKLAVNKATFGASPPPVDLSNVFPRNSKNPTVPNPNPNGYIPNHKYGGKTFLGGDPNKRENWK